MSDVSSNPSRPPSPSASVLATHDLPTARPYRFVWDPSTRRPGPESVAGTTEGGRNAGDYIVGHGQYPLGVLNNPSSMNLALGSLPAEWSSARLGFHAISTVLNNPHKKQAPPKAHSSLPSVPPADLPRVRRRDFDSYLKAVRPEWEKYERNSRIGKEDGAQAEPFEANSIAEVDDVDEDHDDTLLTAQQPQLMYSEGSAVPSSPLPIQARSIPPLDTVPSIFFETEFNLGDARTFNAVTEQSAIASLATLTQSNLHAGIQDMEGDDPSDPLSLSHTLPLLEKFDHYADTVEQHLIREISLRSTSFFAALTNLRDLQTSSTACLSRIQNLRQKLSEVDEGTAKKGLELVKVKRKQDRVKDVKDGVKMVEGVVEMMGVLENLVHAGQWGEALNIVEEVEGMWDAQQDEVEKKHYYRSGHAHGPVKLESMVEEDGEADQDEASKQRNSKSKASGRVIPLSSLTAFSAIPSNLQRITTKIAASLSTELVAVLKEDWVLYVEAKEYTDLESDEAASSIISPHEATETDIGDSSPNFTNGRMGDKETARRSADQGLKDRLKPLLLSLVRTKGLKEGVFIWREVILGEVRSLVSKKLPGIDNDGEDGESMAQTRAGLANHLRNLPQEEFMVFMKAVYRTLMNGIARLKIQGDLISELLDALRPELQRRPKLAPGTAPIAATSKAVSSLPPLLPSIAEDLNDFLCSSCELANTSAAKVISYRSEQHAKLDLPEFVDFFNTSWAFVLQCEVLSRRMIIGLRGTVITQAKQWLQTFHQERISRSAKLVEDEVWSPADVTREMQLVANAIVDSAVKDSPALNIPRGGAQTDTQAKHNGTITKDDLNDQLQTTPMTSSSSRPAGTKHLRIDERTYYTVSATLEVLLLLSDYLRVVVNLRTLTTDTMSRVIEFLKAFNSRTCQVVLGAGAMRSAGLKNISAKHLALASQSLSVVFELIPYIRETFRRHLSQKQTVMLVDFDKLKRDYQEHQNEIHSKLIDIMGSRLSIHIKSLQAVDWTVSGSEGTVSDYMLQVVKDTEGLHKILARYLPLAIFEFVMSEVLAAINHRLSEEYGKIELQDQQAKNRMLEDTRYLNKHFSGLKNIRAPTAMLETVVAEKMLPRPPASPVPSTPSVTRSNTFTNQRLRGLLSGKATGSFVDKALPQPTGQTPSPLVYSESKPTQPPALAPDRNPARSVSSNGLGSVEMTNSISTVSLSLSPPIEEVGSPFEGTDPGLRQTDSLSSLVSTIHPLDVPATTNAKSTESPAPKSGSGG